LRWFCERVAQVDGLSATLVGHGREIGDPSL
jgi:hypothetical protein